MIPSTEGVKAAQHIYGVSNWDNSYPLGAAVTSRGHVVAGAGAGGGVGKASFHDLGVSYRCVQLLRVHLAVLSGKSRHTRLHKKWAAAEEGSPAGVPHVLCCPSLPGSLLAGLQGSAQDLLSKSQGPYRP